MPFLRVLALLVAQPQLPTITVDTRTLNAALTLGVLPDIKGETIYGLGDEDAPGDAVARIWSKTEKYAGDESIAIRIHALLPHADGAAADRLNAERDARRKAILDRGGQTMITTIGRYKVWMTVCYDLAGGVEIFEESATPVGYYRHVAATKGRVAQALELVAKVRLWDGRDPSGLDIYPNGLPTNWSTPFAGRELGTPRPQQGLSVDLSTDTGKVSLVRYADGENADWTIYRYAQPSMASLAELAKVPQPPFAVAPKAEIAAADVIEWSGTTLLRQRGAYGEGEERYDFVSLTGRDDKGVLSTIVLRRKAKASWPTLSIDTWREGKSVESSVWKRPQGLYTRSFGKASSPKFVFSVFGEADAVENDGAFAIHLATGEATLAYVREAARKAAAGWRMDGDAFVPTSFVDSNALVIDVQWKRVGGSWWTMVRYVEPGKGDDEKVYRAETVGTEQGGEPFVLTMVGPDDEAHRKAFKAATLSCKGADGAPLFATYPESAAGTDHLLPHHRLRLPFPNDDATVGATHDDDGTSFIGGPFVGDSRVFYTVDPRNPSVLDEAKAMATIFYKGQKPKAKALSFKRAGKEIPAVRVEYRGKDGKLQLLTTFRFEDGAFVHVRQFKGDADGPWKAFLGIE